MGIVEVRDHALWAKHIHGNEQLKLRLIGLAENELIELVVDGWHGVWTKMANGKDGRPTQGIRGVGTAKTKWHELQSRRGELVTIKLCE